MNNAQFIIVPFMVFFLESILFFHLLPTGGFIWNNLTSMPPNVPADPGWAVWVYMGYGWGLFLWIMAKIVAVLTYLFSLLIIPFSLMVHFPYLAIFHIPLIVVFLIATMRMILPMMMDIIDYIASLAMALINIIAEAIPF